MQMANKKVVCPDGVQTKETTIFWAFFGFFTKNAINFTKIPEMKKYHVRLMCHAREFQKYIHFLLFVKKLWLKADLTYFFQEGGM